MVWISRLVAAILVSVLTIAILAQVFNTTLLSSSYLSSQATKSGVYVAIANDLNDQLVKHLNSGNNQSNITPTQASAIIKTVITPNLVQSKINAALSSIQSYYKGNGPAPVISFADVISKLQAAGLPIGNNNDTLNQTITINGNQKVKEQVQNFEKVKLYSSLAAIVLLFLLLFLCWEEHRWKVLPDIAIITGAELGIISIIFLEAVGVADKYGKINTNSNELTSTANLYAKSLTHGVGEILAIISITLIAIGILSRIIMHNMVKKPNIKPKLSQTKLKPAIK